MLKKILQTTGSRVIITLLNFIILIVNTNALKKEGVGTISLLILGIAIIAIINEFVGGSALIYLIPRYDLFKLFLPSYIWAFMASTIGFFIFKIFNLVPSNYIYHVFFLSLINSYNSINFLILLGKEKINEYNIISVFQVLSLLLSLICFIYLLNKIEVLSYVFSLYIAYSLTFILSFLRIKRFIKVSDLIEIKKILKQIFKYGILVQVANLIQLFNYRLNYYFIEFFIGRASLGLYSAGTQLSEGLWIVGRSVSTIQYTRISNIRNPEYAKRLTLSFLKFTLIITTILLTILLLLPSSVFSFIFSEDFKNIKPVILSLSAGIISIAVSLMFSHYFSGIGKIYINTIGSGIGFVFTLICGLILIPKYHLIGAGITASVSYFMMTLFHFLMFIKISKAKIRDFIITADDYRLFISEIKGTLSKRPR